MLVRSRVRTGKRAFSSKSFFPSCSSSLPSIILCQNSHQVRERSSAPQEQPLKIFFSLEGTLRNILFSGPFVLKVLFLAGSRSSAAGPDGHRDEQIALAYIRTPNLQRPKDVQRHSARLFKTCSSIDYAILFFIKYELKTNCNV